MNILGLKAAGHDVGAAIITDDGRIVAIAEERLSRVKYSDGSFPHLAINYCLKALGLSDSDIGIVAVDPTIVNKAEWVRSEDLVRTATGSRFAHARLVTVNHHDAHAATAFFCSPFKEAAVLVYDGSGEMIRNHLGVVASETETTYRGIEDRLYMLQKTMHAKSARRFPYTMGIGRLYTFFSKNYLGFGPQNEGKMMGLAAYGDDRILKEFPYERFVTRHYGQLICNAQLSYPDRAISSKLSRANKKKRLTEVLFAGIRLRWIHAKDNFLRWLLTHSGETPYRAPDAFEPVRFTHPPRDPEHDALPDKYYSSIAYAAQKIFERFAIEKGVELRDATGSQNLCVAGGCGLNIDANRNYLDVVGFKNIFVQPASSDCGIALGCALWGTHVIEGRKRFWEMKNASLGRSYTSNEVDFAIAEVKEKVSVHISSSIARDAAKLLADGKIIGWFQGGSEYGPRALGNRSILCDARGEDMKDILNARVKHRETWRPFAASVLLDKMSDWFELDIPSPFMLLMAPVRKEKQSIIPAVVHVDGTCRIQSLTKDDNGLYWELVHEFDSLTGTPLLLNTSFNLAGDPIVETPAEALDTFLRSDMDYLVLEDRIVSKRGKDI